MIKFVSLSEFIRYRAIKAPPFNYFKTLRGSWSDFYGPSGLLQFGRFGTSSEIGTTWAELSWADFFMGRVVLGRLVFGPSCPEPLQNTCRLTVLSVNCLGTVQVTASGTDQLIGSKIFR